MTCIRIRIKRTYNTLETVVFSAVSVSVLSPAMLWSSSSVSDAADTLSDVLSSIVVCSPEAFSSKDSAFMLSVSYLIVSDTLEAVTSDSVEEGISTTPDSIP